MRSNPRLLWPLAAGLLFLIVGCSTTPRTPDQTFRAFVAQLQAGNVDGAWDLLSADSQEELTRLVRERSEASGGAIPDDPKRVALGDAGLVRPIDEVTVQEETADRAVLLVRSGDETQQVLMVREGGSWKVSLVDGGGEAQ